MIVEKELRKLLHQLVNTEVAQIALGQSLVTVHIFDHATKIFLSANIYVGENYIPKSVRECLSKKPTFAHSHLPSTVSLDEEHFSITLNYLGALEHLNKRMFVDLLEEFSALADEWRLFLDENDKRDLIHVYHKR